MTTSPPESTTTAVNLLDLAASALASTVAASRPIRERSALASDGQDKNARTKLDGTIVTDADGDAQGIIVRALLRISNKIRIVGEESQEEMKRHTIREFESDASSEHIFRCAKEEVYMRFENKNTSSPSSNEPLPLAEIEYKSKEDPHQSLNESSSGSLPVQSKDETYLVDPSRVSVFVDPLDGTKCYANGQYDSVSILIAVILDNTPWFGVICKPFGSIGLPSILDTGCAAVYGGTLLGGVYIAGSDKWSRLEPNPENLPRAILPMPSKSVGAVQDFVDHLARKGVVHAEPIHASGAGEKSMRLVLGINNEGLWFWPKGGTSRWDVAASDALLRASGGRLTDRYGEDLDYSTPRTESENQNGIIACSNISMHQECMMLFRESEFDETLS